MYHEHQRPDRDQHIRIQWKNIKQGNVQCSLLSLVKINVHMNTQFTCNTVDMFKIEVEELR